MDAAWDLAAHDLSVANHWLSAEPLSVNAVGGAWINPGLADAVFLTFRYPNEVLLNVHASWLNPRKDRMVTVVGDQRMLTFDDMATLEPLRIYDKQVTDQRQTGFLDARVSDLAAQTRRPRHEPNVEPQMGVVEQLANRD